MTSRRVLALVALAALAALAGCSTILGPGEPDESALGRNVTYDWNTTANATFDVNGSRALAVYRVPNSSEMEFYRRDALGTEHPLEMEGLKFRYDNGTVVNLTGDDVELTRQRAKVSLPADEGRVAFYTSRSGKTFALPTFVQGTYEVTLPEGAHVGVPILAQVNPGGYERSSEDGRVTLEWEDVQSRSISVRYYVGTDLWLFGGLLGIAIVLGVGGAAYYLRQIRQLEAKREEVGLDVDTDDDDLGDDGPPPGMG